MVEHIELYIEDLLLDQENPRIGSVQSQSEALESIIKLNENHCRKLMLSIKDNGLDPGDSLYVIKADNGEDFIVLEGNRRLTALRILNNPDVLNGTGLSEKTKKSLVNVSTGFDKSKVETVHCVWFDHREQANEWIQRRHTGTAEGVGRIQWSPLEIQRFTKDHSVLDVIDFVERNTDYSDKDWKRTKSSIESQKSSTVTRLLESAAGRKHIGISTSKIVDEKIPFLSSDPQWALKVLMQMFEDVRDGKVDSRDLNKASDIEDYFNGLPAALQPNSRNSGNQAVAFKDIQIKPKSSPGKGIAKTKPQTKVVPQSRRALAPRRHPFNIPNSTKGESLLREASSLNADKYTLSAAFVLRSFVELAINDYMNIHRLPKTTTNPNGIKQPLDLSKKAERVSRAIVARGTFENSDLRGFRNRLMIKTSSCSIQSLNGFIHNKFQIPTADELRAGWDASEPIFIATYGRV